MDYEQYLKKSSASENVTHERQSKAEKEKPMEGYEPHPKEEKLSELFGMKNSFDNISVGMDSKGSIAVAVTSQKELNAPTLTSDSKVLKGTRKRTLYDHFGEVYTDPFSPQKSAFAYRSRRTISENRMLAEFKNAAKKRLSRDRREAAPFLTLDEDKEELSRIRGKQENTPESLEEKGRIEQAVLRKTELENRFLRRLRIARFQNIPKPEEQRRVMQSELYALTGRDDGQSDDVNNENIEEEQP